jgi:hypothetical protein
MRQVHLLGVVFCAAAMAESPDYQSPAYYQHAWLSCTDLYPTHEVSASQDLGQERADCYAALIEKTFRHLPPDSPERLAAALKGVPEMADIALQQALDAGMEVYYSLTLATRTLPARSEDFERLALANGADPTLTLQATAAGKK